MLKICRLCKRELEANSIYFHNNKVSKDGLNYICKQCAKQLGAEYYKQNKGACTIATKRARARNGDRLRQLKIVLKGCCICGESEPYCLDFHHPNKDKEGEISNLIRKRKLEFVLQEIRKCVLLCANCHRKVHYGIIPSPAVKDIEDVIQEWTKQFTSSTVSF